MKEKTSSWVPHTGLALHKWLEVGVTESSILLEDSSPGLAILAIGLMSVATVIY